MKAEQLARLFHETYEELAPRFNYETRKASAKPWEEVPENNRNLMIAVAEKILSVKKKQTAEDCIEDCAVVDDNRNLQEELDRHTQQGGITMTCEHPVQCAYSEAQIDGGNGCSMCDLVSECNGLKDKIQTIIRNINTNTVNLDWIKKYLRNP